MSTYARLLALALAVGGFAFLLPGRPGVHASPTTYTVNSAADPGDGVCDTTECTLREAIDGANGNPSTDTIAFNIPGDGPHTIRPAFLLPDVMDPVIIDGYTQPGASPNTNGPGLGTNAVLKVELDGSTSDEVWWGLLISGGRSTIRGLVINRFLGAGIFISDQGGNIIEGNFIGTDVSGTAALGNGGVVIETSFNTIGGTTPEARNVISGSSGDGVYMYFGGGNVVEGNFIGLDATGTAGLPNSQFGVSIYTSTNNIIGGTTPEARNVISMNFGAGVDLGNGANGNLVQGNYIGTDVTGTATPSYYPEFFAQFGVLVEDAANNTIGGTATGARNVISGNGDGIGILRSGAIGNSVEGNFIGTDAAGGAALGNTSNGVDVFVEATGNTIGGTASGAGNVIAYNGANGVRVYGAGTTANVIWGNSIHSNAGRGIENESGGNTELAPPVITGSGSLSGTACANCTIEVYSDDEDEGRVYEGSTVANSAGNWTFNGSLLGPNVTAAATDAARNTSEFSSPFAVGLDSDRDGFSDSVEAYLGTDPLDACPDDVGSDDAWPLDIDMSKDISVTGDVFNFRGRLGATPGSPNWWQRLDLDRSGDISSTGDVFLYRGTLGMTCTRIAAGGMDTNPCNNASGIGGPCTGAGGVTFNNATMLGQIDRCTGMREGFGGLDGVTDTWVDAYVSGGVPALTEARIWLAYDNSKVNVCTSGSAEQTLKLGDGAFTLGDVTPPCDTDGSFNAHAINLTGAGPAGDGEVMRFGLDIDFTSPYVTSLIWNKFVVQDAVGPVVINSTKTGMLAVNTNCPLS